MNKNVTPIALSRRELLHSSAVVVSFSLLPQCLQSARAEVVPPMGDLKEADFLDAWIGVDASGRVTVFSGKAELGQGITTALMQLAAEQLVVSPVAVTMVMASTAQTPNESYTAGSNSMSDSGNAIARAAAQVR